MTASTRLDSQLLQSSFSGLDMVHGWFGLKRRLQSPEIMDQPDLARAAHETALRGLARTNCWGLSRRMMAGEICRIARQRRLSHMRVLDVASGAGDFAIWASRYFARRGLNARIDGCDISSTAVEFASRRAAAVGLDGLTFFRWDALNDPLPSGYDFVTCSLFLHHLNEAQAVMFLRKIAAVARYAVLIDDLRRSLVGYGLAVLAAAALTRSPVVRVDAPRSVRAAFATSEVSKLLAAAGLQDAAVRRHWPQRYLVVWEKPWTARHDST